MPGLVPGIHVFGLGRTSSSYIECRKKDVDARAKRGHDGSFEPVIAGHSASEDARERAYDPAIHPPS
jgi:hypothetical protein